MAEKKFKPLVSEAWIKTAQDKLTQAVDLFQKGRADSKIPPSPKRALKKRVKRLQRRLRQATGKKFQAIQAKKKKD